MIKIDLLKNHPEAIPKIICSEKHIELIWMPISSLQAIDFRAEPLKKLLPKWITGNSDNKFMSEMI